MTGNTFNPSGFRAAIRGFIVLALISCCRETARGQEALRISLAGDLAAAAQKQANSSLGYYNLLLGPVAWRFASGLGLEYNDNIRAQQNAQGDFIFRPNVNAQMHWPVTQINELNLSLSAGYSAYVQHKDLNQFYVTPGSGLSFDIYVGDCVINLHDRLSITENAYQNQSTAGNNTYASLQNTAGASALWDLNTVVASLGYDHGNYLALNGGAGQPDAASENFSLNVGARVAPEILAGVEAGGGLIHYSGATTVAVPDARQWNVGAFCTATISEYLQARLDAGYTEFLPETTTANFNSAAASGFYAQFLLTHQVNQFFNYSLSAGRSVDLQYNGQPYERTTVRCQPNWYFLKHYSVSTPLWWEHGSQVYLQTVTYDQYGAGLNVGRQITEKLSAGLAFQFIKENSSQPGLNYTDRIVSLNFTYQF